MRFAPGGELFVASSSALSTGGNSGAGLGAIVQSLPDDNLDGVARFDAHDRRASPTPGAANQGMLFPRPAFFYYQDGNGAISAREQAGGDADRRGCRSTPPARSPCPQGSATMVADLFGPNIYLVDPALSEDDGHGRRRQPSTWATASDQGEACIDPHTFVGGVVQIDHAPGGPIPERQSRRPGDAQLHRHHRCAKEARQVLLQHVQELAKDYSSSQAGREAHARSPSGRRRRLGVPLLRHCER